MVAGNWKMNKTVDEAKSLTAELMAMVADEVKSSVQVVICVPFPYLTTIKAQLGANSKIQVGAQNVSDQDWGAFTGEVSAPMLKSIGIRYVIVGHSDRRQYFGENGKLLATKVDKVLSAGMTPIFCCGEPLDIREKGTHEQLVRSQVAESLFHLTADQLRRVVVAYEPVWAIGTGKTATPAQAQEAHKYIRSLLEKMYNKAIAEQIRIQYGGSVKPENASELMRQTDIDGALVGGASLKIESFSAIVKNSLGVKK